MMEAIFLSYMMKTYGSADDDGEPPNLLVSRKATMVSTSFTKVFAEAVSVLGKRACLTLAVHHICLGVRALCNVFWLQ